MLKVDKPVNDSGVIIPDEIFDFYPYSNVDITDREKSYLNWP